MVTQKTKPLAFTFVFTVCVLQNIFPLFQEKKKKKRRGRWNPLHTDSKITDKLQPNVSLGSFA